MVKNRPGCAVPGCNNEITEEQQGKRKAICSSCEAAKMHICEACGKQMSVERIQDGATLCKECEMNPTELEEQMEPEQEPGMSDYDMESEESEEDFMV